MRLAKTKFNFTQKVTDFKNIALRRIKSSENVQNHEKIDFQLHPKKIIDFDKISNSRKQYFSYNLLKSIKILWPCPNYRYADNPPPPVRSSHADIRNAQ